MEKLYVNQSNKKSAEVIMGNKINELVKGYNEIMEIIKKHEDFFNHLEMSYEEK